MATDVEIYKVILQVEGEAEVARLGKLVGDMETDLQKMIQKFGVGSNFVKMFANDVADARAQLTRAQSDLKIFGDAAVSATGKAEQAARRMTQAFSSIGYVIDDLQYIGEQGLRPIINNIQNIASSFGPWGAAIGAVATAMAVLYEHADKLWDLMGGGFPKPALTGLEALNEQLKKATSEMEALMKQTRLEWYELDKLAKLKGQIAQLTVALEAARNVQAAGDQLSKAESERGKGFKEAIAESGGKNAIDEFRDKLEGEKDAKGLVYDETTGKMAPVDVAANNMLNAAIQGDKRVRDIIQKKLDPNSRFAKNIGKFSPEAKAAEEAEARKAERTNEALDQEQAANKADAEARKERANAAAGRIGGGIDDTLESGIFNDLKKGKSPEEAMNAARGTALGYAKGRGVKDDILGDVTDKLLEKAKEAAQNAIAEGKKPKINADWDKFLGKQAEIIGGANEELMKDRLANAREDRDKALDRRNSQVVGAADLANSIQGGVGGPMDLQKQTNERLDKIRDIQTQQLQQLQKLNQNRPAMQPVAFGANGQLQAGG